MKKELQEFEIEATDNYDMLWKYADGYYNSANNLLDQLLNVDEYDFYPAKMKESILNIEQQSQIFPILFLYRHYIELALKGVYIKNVTDLKKCESIMNHSIKEVWSKLKKDTNILNNSNGDYFDLETIDTIDDIINYFSKLDDDSYKSRYPFSKKLVAYNKNNIKINLLDLKFNIGLFYEFIGQLL